MRKMVKLTLTADVSDSSSSSSSDDESVHSVANTTVDPQEDHDETMADDLDIDVGRSDNEDEDSRPPKARIPPALDIKDGQAKDEEFESYYMGLVATEFAEDLDAVRQSNDFGGGSLAVLINALKNGANIFDPAQRRAILDGKDMPSLEL